MAKEMMSICVNGQSQVPPGFRFHPTEEELLMYYLGKKVSYEKIDLDVIREVDLNKLEPWDIQERCKIGSTPQNDWYFFSHKDKKYPTGSRTNRATAAGFWKATGRDKVIHSNCTRIGMRKTLVFYKGRAPHGHKSDWIMHEYRLDDVLNVPHTSHVSIGMGGQGTPEEGWVVCRIFKKKSYHKALVETPIMISSSTSSSSAAETRIQRQMMMMKNQGTLEQIIQYMGGSISNCKDEDEDEEGDYDIHDEVAVVLENSKRFLSPMDQLHMKLLPSLELSPIDYSMINATTTTPQAACYHQDVNNNNNIDSSSSSSMSTNDVQVVSTGADPNTAAYNINHYYSQTGLNNWSDLEQLIIASQLNGPTKYITPFCSTVDHHHNHHDFQLLQPIIRSSTVPSSTSISSPLNSTTHQNNHELDIWSFSGTSSLSYSTEPQCHLPNAPV